MNKQFTAEPTDELRPEYELNELLKGGVRGKYVTRYQTGANVVMLEPDVAQAFPTEAVVNEALRLVMRMAQLPQRPTDAQHETIQTPRPT